MINEAFAFGPVSGTSTPKMSAESEPVSLPLPGERMLPDLR